MENVSGWISGGQELGGNMVLITASSISERRM